MGFSQNGGISGRPIDRESTLAGRGGNEPEPRIRRNGEPKPYNEKSVTRSRRRTAHLELRDDGRQVEHSTELGLKFAVARIRDRSASSCYNLAARRRFHRSRRLYRLGPASLRPGGRSVFAQLTWEGRAAYSALELLGGQKMSQSLFIAYRKQVATRSIRAPRTHRGRSPK